MVSRLSTYTAAEFQLCSFHYLDSNYPPASNISPAFKILKILAVMVIGKNFICKVSITLGNLQVARSIEYCSIWLTCQDSNSGLLGSPNAEALFHVFATQSTGNVNLGGRATEEEKSW